MGHWQNKSNRQDSTEFGDPHRARDPPGKDQDARDTAPAMSGIQLSDGERWTLPLKAPKVSTPWRESDLVTEAEAAAPSFTGRQRLFKHSLRHRV